MSWAEVRKFINSGKVPLNELLEPVDAVETYVTTGTANNELKTVLDITGSGRLHCVSVTNLTRSNSRIIVTLDGEVVFDGSVHNNHADYSNVFHLGNDEQIKFSSVGTSCYINTPFFEVSTAYSGYKHAPMRMPFNADEKSITGSRIVVIADLTAPLRFKESLTIQVKGTSSNDKYGILYDLG